MSHLARRHRLVAVKLLHTLIWAVIASAILVLPILGLLRRFDAASLVIGMVALEGLVLALNRNRCPFTDLAERYTDDRGPNHDIYLPAWIAVNNRRIFGSIFAVGLVVVLVRWWTSP